MATQDSKGLSLSFNHDQQNFRLLELPPELLDSLTSENAPVLSVKSSPLPSSRGTSSASGLMTSHAVLTTQSQTFQLRQVQSSNSIFLLQPRLPCVSDADDDLTAVPYLSVVAQCKATLELIRSPTSPVTWLQELLPVYNGPREGTRVASSSAFQGTLAERRSKRDHLTNLPLSDDEFESGWREIRAFESDGQAFKPSVLCLVGAWRAVVSASTAHGINLDREFRITDILGILEADDYPTSLVEAVLWNLMTPESVYAGSMCVDENKCIRWVGATMLEAMGKQSTPISDFLEAWKNELPEQWRRAATLEALEQTNIDNNSILQSYIGLPVAKRVLSWGYERIRENLSKMA